MWHYADESGEVGPITLGQLVSALAKNNTGSETLVWRPGLADWMRASEVPEIASLLLLPPPPLPKQFHVGNKKPQQVFNQEAGRGGCAGLGVFGILIVVLIISTIRPENKRTDNRPVVPTCRTDYALCSNNEEMVRTYSKMFDARRGCKRAVEEAAQFGTPDFNIYFFGSFKAGGDFPASGKVTLIDDDVRFKNALNTLIRTRVVCSYDFKSGVATIDSSN